MRLATLAALGVVLALGACADAPKDPYAKAGFYTHVHEGRLWVLKACDKDIDTVARNQEPRVVVTRIAAGPDRMTVKSNEAKVIDDYLAAM